MELVGVSHGLTLQELIRWEALATSLGAKHWRVYDTGIPAFDAKTSEVSEVSNSHYEFGGYLAGSLGVQSEGPYVIVNSTVFQTRSLWAWKWILRSSNGFKAPIFGDATPSPDPYIEEIPHPYYASWIFLVRDREALKAFSDALVRVLGTVTPKPSPAYAAYLQRWLEPRSRLYGWHGTNTSKALARKKQTIQWEHRLSKELWPLGIQSFAKHSPWHAMAQFLDKIHRHWASFAKY
jgi:hypothetical protein